MGKGRGFTREGTRSINRDNVYAKRAREAGLRAPGWAAALFGRDQLEAALPFAPAAPFSPQPAAGQRRTAVQQQNGFSVPGHQLTSDRREHRPQQRKPLHLGAGKPLSRGFPARRSLAPICARCRCSRGLCGPSQTAGALVERRGAAFRWERGVPVFEVPGKPLSGGRIPARGQVRWLCQGSPRPPPQVSAR